MLTFTSLEKYLHSNFINPQYFDLNRLPEKQL